MKARSSSETSRTVRANSSERTRVGVVLALPFFALLILFLATEVICRFVIGLGDPPHYIADSKIEYLLLPSKTYYRFHKRFAVNQYSMRSDDFPPRKSDANEFRVLVIGDSVIYGGVRIDQADIDTEVLKRNLKKDLGRPDVVGNASAKSWGSPNELAYLQRFGTLDADVVILELSSHDYADAPTFIPVVGVAAAYPEKKPALAVTDLLRTYIFPRLFHVGETPAAVDRSLPGDAPTAEEIAQCRDAERDFFRFARAHNAQVSLVQHLTLPELSRGYEPGYYANQAVARDESVPFIDDADGLREALRKNTNPFNSQDAIHLNAAGQIILARTLETAVHLALNTR